MKFRSDFVSNSSSCSFIIHITDSEKKQKLDEIVKKYNIALTDFFNSDVDGIMDGDWFQVYCGDDTIENIDTFYDDIQPDIEKIGADCYEVGWEHYSFGKKLPINKGNRF